MKKLQLLVIHTTLTPEGREITRSDIEKWHIKENGWSRVGYSDMVHLNGDLENLIPFDQDEYVDNFEISNGAKGYNLIARHIVYVGGAGKEKWVFYKNYPPKDTRTKKQKETLLTYVKYTILRHPNIRVVGHNELSNKQCPCFNVGDWLRSECIPEKNIGLIKNK